MAYSGFEDLVIEEILPKKPQLEGYLLIEETFDVGGADFGFATAASVSGGTLQLTKKMEDCRTSVKEFDAAIAAQPKIDVCFDWKNYLAADDSRSNRTGIEFRDMYGRLLFAIGSGEGGTQLYFATTGYDSDSYHCDPEWEPDWSQVSLDAYEFCNVRLKADFEEKVISFTITGSDGEILVEQMDVPTEATGLFKMVACNYDTNSGVGTQSIDNFYLAGSEEKIELPLRGKTMYVFGDSIAAGFRYWPKYETEVKRVIGFAEFVAKKEGMEVLYNGSRAGSTLMPGSELGYIVDQIAIAPEEQPDYIIFDGGINDAFPYNDWKWGVVLTSGDIETFDIGTLAGNFENLIYQMKQKWPDAQLIYVDVHKVDADRAARQETVHNITTAACRKWGVKVVDLYNSEFNAREQEIRWTYTSEAVGCDGLPGTRDTVPEWVYTDYSPSGLHPNYLGIETYYVPAVSQVLRETV